jgi:hypothetical protein
MIIEAQFGLLDVGITALAVRLTDPSRISRSIAGVVARRTPSGLIPSTPTITTCNGSAIAVQTSPAPNSKTNGQVARR